MQDKGSVWEIYHYVMSHIWGVKEWTYLLEFICICYYLCVLDIMQYYLKCSMGQSNPFQQVHNYSSSVLFVSLVLFHEL